MYNSQALDNIRKRIDEIDNTIHDLLMERAGLASDIAAEKKRRNMPIVHPAREARMVRRLLARHKGPLPQPVIARIWRELVGAVSMLQSGLTAVYYSTDYSRDEWDILRNYFGSVLPISMVDTIEDAIEEVTLQKRDFAILPFPSLYSENSWWTTIVDTALREKSDQPLHFMQALPFVTQKDNEPSFLILGRGSFETSDDDFSFLALRSDSPIAQETIEQVFSNKKISATSLSANIGDAQSHYLCKIPQYIAPNSEVLVQLSEAFGEGVELCHLGGYPKAITV